MAAARHAGRLNDGFDEFEDGGLIADRCADPLRHFGCVNRVGLLTDILTDHSDLMARVIKLHEFWPVLDENLSRFMSFI